MSKLFEQGIEAVKDLSEDRQDMAGELLLTLADTKANYHLTQAQVKDIELALAEANRGEFATDEEKDALWKKSVR